jgi:hypothetical protein
MLNNKNILLLSGSVLASIGTAFLLYRQFGLASRIVMVAKKYIGEREIEPNQGFVNKSFEKIMYQLGQWRPSYEWCACFARLIWLLVLTGRKREIANRLLSPSSQLTFANFAADKSGLFEVSPDKPKPGAIVIWQSRAQPHKGHAGIFITKLGKDFITIEGNQGQKVSICKYSPEKMQNPTQILKLRGFINLKSII